MKKNSFLILLIFILSLSPFSAFAAKELPKIAVWDLAPRNTPATHAQELTSILVSEIAKLEKFEAYSQENVRALAGWTAERMKLGCTDTQCLIALGQMDIVKLISGSVGKIGNRYSISLSLFDTQNARSENAISKFCNSEDELIELVQQTVRELLGAPVESAAVSGKIPAKKEPEKTFTNSIGMDFVLIPAGRFFMGSPWYEMGRDTNDEGPRHEVEITRSFYIGKYEVKVGEFRRFVKETGYKTDAETKGGAAIFQTGKWVKQPGMYWGNPGFSQSDLHPVTCLSWMDAVRFAGWLSKKTSHKYRLPTEAEWEYASRAGTQTARYWGKSENEACRYANVIDRLFKPRPPDSKIHDCEDGYPNTAPVGSFRPNAFGLYDVLGNVWELCADWYEKDYYKKSPPKDPAGPTGGSNRVSRGGAWSSPPEFVRCAKRIGVPPFGSSPSAGLRLVRNIE